MSIFSLLYNIDVFKTIRFNFKYFKASVAWRLPVFVYRHTRFLRLGGQVEISGAVTPGMVRLGRYSVGIEDERTRTIWEVGGRLVINGPLVVGRGCRISIGERGVMTIGKNVTLNGASQLACHHEMSIGDDSLLSWGILMMDTDFHKILDREGRQCNENRPVRIGNHVWIGCRSLILKGVRIPDNSAVAAGSILAHSFDKENCIIGGQGPGARILKSDVTWES